MRIAIAIGVSVLVHLILAAGLWWYFATASGPVVLAQLDLSGLEFSLADEDVSTAVPVASLPAVAEPTAEKPAPDMPKPPAPTPDSVEPTMPTLAEPLPPEARAEVPDLPEVRNQVRPEFSKQEVTKKSEPRASEAPAVPAVAPKQAHVDAPPSLKRAIRPDYPRGARLRKEEGDVVLEIHVAASGDVSEVRVVGSCGFAELDAAAVRAAKAARFTAAKAGRESVASVARLKLTFKLK